MFGFWGGGGYDDFGFGGPDRRNWRDKSDAAIRRENQAKALFDAFFEKSKAPSTQFPLTQEVVPCHVHLTDPCWKTFKQYVDAKGCVAKRRQATPAERMASKETRKSKLWVVSVTIPVHPAQALEVKRQKEAKAKAAAEAKKKKQEAAAEQQRVRAEQRAAEEAALQVRIQKEYQTVLAAMGLGEGGTSSGTDDAKPNVLAHHAENTTSTQTTEEGAEKAAAAGGEENDESSPTKKRKLLTPLTAPRGRLLEHAQEEHVRRCRVIEQEIMAEKRNQQQQLLAALAEQMRAKKEHRLEEARAQRDRIQETIGELTRRWSSLIIGMCFGTPGDHYGTAHGRRKKLQCLFGYLPPQ